MDPKENKPAPDTPPQINSPTSDQPTRSPKSEPARTQVNEGGLPRVRTFKEDVAEAVKGQKASLTSIAAAEARWRARMTSQDSAEQTESPVQKIAMVLGGIVFVAIGIAAVSYGLFFYEPERPTIEEAVSSLIFAEKQTRVDITDLSARSILGRLEEKRQSTQLSLGQIAHLYLTTTDATTGELTLLTAQDFLRAIDARVSSAFLRSLDPDFMLGIHSFDRNQTFLIFTTDSYQHAFSGMLDWEPSMIRELSPLVLRNVDNASKRAIDPQTKEEIVYKKSFEDVIIQNIDARVLRSDTEITQLLYAFPDQRTLIITTNENTLIEVITRLRNVRVF
ncbi:MAG: hypothetical protein OQJ98_03195 [Candidatus Pacebacteria bacterium]|nr:hypothetical protein [Candidatus Paceibacterota bacterium]